jgi:hypothetical protein
LMAKGSIAIVSVLVAPGLAFALTCRASEGGATFTPPDIREVPAAAVEAKGRKGATSSTTLTANVTNPMGRLA